MKHVSEWADAAKQPANCEISQDGQCSYEGIRDVVRRGVYSFLSSRNGAALLIASGF